MKIYRDNCRWAVRRGGGRPPASLQRPPLTPQGEPFILSDVIPSPLRRNIALTHRWRVAPEKNDLLNYEAQKVSGLVVGVDESSTDRQTDSHVCVTECGQGISSSSSRVHRIDANECTLSSHWCASGMYRRSINVMVNVTALHACCALGSYGQDPYPRIITDPRGHHRGHFVLRGSSRHLCHP